MKLNKKLLESFTSKKEIPKYLIKATPLYSQDITGLFHIYENENNKFLYTVDVDGKYQFSEIADHIFKIAINDEYKLLHGYDYFVTSLYEVKNNQPIIKLDSKTKKINRHSDKDQIEFLQEIKKDIVLPNYLFEYSGYISNGHTQFQEIYVYDNNLNKFICSYDEHCPFTSEEIKTQNRIETINKIAKNKNYHLYEVVNFLLYENVNGQLHKLYDDSYENVNGQLHKLSNDSTI